MGKFLLFILFGVLLYRILKRAPQTGAPRPAAVPPVAETMIRCTHCGVHVPIGESLAEGGRHYCCEEHRRLGRR